MNTHTNTHINNTVRDRNITKAARKAAKLLSMSYGSQDDSVYDTPGYKTLSVMEQSDARWLADELYALLQDGVVRQAFNTFKEACYEIGIKASVVGLKLAAEGLECADALTTILHESRS